MNKEISMNKEILFRLKKGVDENRLPHAQLFVGSEGVGLLKTAIDYAKYILCSAFKDDENAVLNCINKVDLMSHPDINYIYPVTTTNTVKSHPVSANFISEWITFIKKYPYGSLQDWYSVLEVDKKQGQIGVDDALEIVKKLSLKSYEGGYKIMIIWMADKMNIAASNKILKILEEPPQKTVFLLLTEKIDDILPTIISRCQLVELKKPTQEEIEMYLKEMGTTDFLAKKYAFLAQGNINKALKLVSNEREDTVFETLFIRWIRAAYVAKGNPEAILKLIAWADELAGYGREMQKQFLEYCIEFFRQALLLNYNTNALVYLNDGLDDFDLNKFAPFVNGSNIQEIFKELSEAVYHVERNGNGKIIFADLSIKLTRLIHKK
ncbi:MAG TPA: DNA polymerase III subunit delta' [Flavobacterium sp.]|nr:DNA polymerase III subunit delta' [Flavobacterium sp.]